MICKACGEAGDMLIVARDSKVLGDLWRTVIRLKHQECSGACDCQHRVP